MKIRASGQTLITILNPLTLTHLNSSTLTHVHIRISSISIFILLFSNKKVYNRNSAALNLQISPIYLCICDSITCKSHDSNRQKGPLSFIFNCQLPIDSHMTKQTQLQNWKLILYQEFNPFTKKSSTNWNTNFKEVCKKYNALTA